MNFNREQLEALKRQIEEDYRLDLAAIDRLLRNSANGGSARHRTMPSDTKTPASA